MNFFNNLCKLVGYLVVAIEFIEDRMEKHRLKKANEKANGGDQRDLESQNGGTRHSYDGLLERPKRKPPGDLAD